MADGGGLVEGFGDFPGVAFLFGGASAVSIQGAWLSGDELVNENITKVYAFTDALSDKALDAVWGCAKMLQVERHQDSVGVEIDGAFYLIEG